MTVSIIVPNFNGKELLEHNIPFVVKALDWYCSQTKSRGELIIVDDGSTDTSVESIADIIEKNKTEISFVLIENKKNYGFAYSVNTGVSKAGGETVVLLNSDVIPEKEFLMPLLHHFKNEKTFAVGCMDKSIENGTVVLRGRGIGKWEKGLFLHTRGEVDSDNTLWVNGGSGAFRRSLWEKLKGMDRIYAPFYWEDIDLSYRALKSGYSLFFEKKSVVEHLHEKGAIKKHFTREKILTVSYRNQFIFIWKNITDFKYRLQHLIWMPYHIVKAVVRMDGQFLKGFFLALILLPKIIQSNIMARRFFIKTDKAVLSSLHS